MADDRGSEAGGDRSRLQPHALARRQRLLSREDLRHGRQEFSVCGGAHDRHEPGRLRPHDARRRPRLRSCETEGGRVMARITAGISCSHVPAIGAAIDQGKTQQPYWAPLFAGFEFTRKWMAANTPDVVFLVYNDHATAFSLEIIPTFAIGCAAGADRTWGSRARRAHLRERHPAGLRSHHREQDGCRPWPDRSAVTDVWPAESVAVPRDPVRRERRAVPAAIRPSLLPAWQGAAARDRKL